MKINLNDKLETKLTLGAESYVRACTSWIECTPGGKVEAQWHVLIQALSRYSGFEEPFQVNFNRIRVELWRTCDKVRYIEHLKENVASESVIKNLEETLHNDPKENFVIEGGFWEILNIFKAGFKGSASAPFMEFEIVA